MKKTKRIRDTTKQTKYFKDKKSLDINNIKEKDFTKNTVKDSQRFKDKIIDKKEMKLDDKNIAYFNKRYKDFTKTNLKEKAYEKEDDNKSSKTDNKTIKKKIIRRYKKRNFKEDEVFVRKEENNTNEQKNKDKAKDNSDSKDKKSKHQKRKEKILNEANKKKPSFENVDNDKILRRLEHKKDLLLQKEIPKKDSFLSKTRNKTLGGVSNSSSLLASYMSTGSSENVGAEGSEKSLNKVASVSRRLSNFRKNKREKALRKKESKLKMLDEKITKRISKLEFREELKKLKLSDEYKKSSLIKKFFRKKQLKKLIYQKYEITFKDKVKKKFKEILTNSFKFILKKVKRTLFIGLGILFLFISISSLILPMGAVIGNTSNTIATSSYLSSEDVLKGINNHFIALESKLQNEVDTVKENNPNYDEYIFTNTEEIGHSVHELLAYITARYGIVEKVSDVDDSLKELFNEMYDLEYKEEIQIRYKLDYYIDYDEFGNEVLRSYYKPYEYKKLYITLHKKEMDGIIRNIFKDYPTNLSHYETLFQTQGNMGELFGNQDLIIQNGGIGGGVEYEASREIQKKIVDSAYITPLPGAGWCAMWVSQVYQNAGLGYIGGNANDMYRNYTFTSDKSKLQVGMLVAVESSSSGGSAGKVYGHVGIYIGDGKVMDNIGRIRVTTLDDWINTFCKTHPVGFGYPKNINGH